MTVPSSRSALSSSSSKSNMLVSLTVGKIDAGVCVLLTEDKRLIEFPSILLPPNITSGSIVDVNVSRNFDAEQRSAKAFKTLQSTILDTFGTDEPSAPLLRCRNATQTSVVLEWDPISLAKANLRSLGLYRNGAKAGNIPRPLEMTSTKISGLAVDTEYTFNLVLRTSAGTYSSDKLVVRTHKMTDLSGITITPGVMAQPLRESLEHTVERIGAKLIEQVRIDTTHFVCTEEKGAAFQKAKDMNIPIVVPDWIKGCEREGRLVGVRGYYLNADPKLRQVGSSLALQRESSQQSVATQSQRRISTPPETSQTPVTNVIPPTPERPQDRDEEEEDDDDDDDDGDDGNKDDGGDDDNIAPQKPQAVESPVLQETEVEDPRVEKAQEDEEVEDEAPNREVESGSTTPNEEEARDSVANESLEQSAPKGTENFDEVAL